MRKKEMNKFLALGLVLMGIAQLLQHIITTAQGLADCLMGVAAGLELLGVVFVFCGEDRLAALKRRLLGQAVQKSIQTR
jgi:uncharacterized membrane protein YjfL (UPF0719 family)